MSCVPAEDDKLRLLYVVVMSQR